MARVSTYLNFPSNTEEAFTFYKSVFKTEFGGNGIVRFGDMPADNGAPMAADIKNLVLHVELPITAGHILMGTDAPEAMGFHLSFGNNMHINLELDSKQETKRLFDILSKGGKTIMPPDDVFWGAYFGACVDKFGVNWMLNCNQLKN